MLGKVTTLMCNIKCFPTNNFRENTNEPSFFYGYSNLQKRSATAQFDSYSRVKKALFYSCMDNFHKNQTERPNDCFCIFWQQLWSASGRNKTFFSSNVQDGRTSPLISPCNIEKYDIFLTPWYEYLPYRGPIRIMKSCAQIQS